MIGPLGIMLALLSTTGIIVAYFFGIEVGRQRERRRLTRLHYAMPTSRKLR